MQSRSSGGRPASWAMNAAASTASSSSGSASLNFIQTGSSAMPTTAPSSGPQQNQLARQLQEKSSLSSFATSGGASSASLISAASGVSIATSSEQYNNQTATNQPGQQQQANNNDEQQQEENRKLRLQLYVFALRCISYPFNAKLSNINELSPKQQQLKLKKQQLDQIIQAHSRFLKSSLAASVAQHCCPHQHIKSISTGQLKQLDELYETAHHVFNKKFLQNERMKILVESECCSQQDLRELFRHNAHKILNNSSLFAVSGHGGSIRQRPIDNSSSTNDSSNLQASKELIVNSWLVKFESVIREQQASEQSSLELTTPSSSVLGLASDLVSPANVTAAPAKDQQQQPMSKEQLYQMFQNILNIKKFEHQLLYNALQLDSSDEQAAAIRRELDGRISRIAELERNKKLLPKFVLKEMECLYLEEARMSVNKLMVNLDNLPVLKGGNISGGSSSHSGAQTESRGYGLQKFRRYNNRAQASLNRDGLVESHPSEPTLTKLDVVLTFNIEVIVMEVRGNAIKSLASNREIYCTMEIEGSDRLQTEHVKSNKPLWDTQGDFTTNHPLPVLKIKLYAVNASMLSLEDKELGKLVLRPTVLSPKTPEWCTMQGSSSSLGGSSGSHPSNQAGGQSEQDLLKIRVIVRMDRPQQLKHCGYLYGIGKSTWRKLKRRYHILIQVSQYTFVMCSYRDKKSKPTEMLHLEGYTVDYIEPPTDLIMEHCSEMTANELHSHSSSSSSSTPFGLAGRLANVILKQPNTSSSDSQLDSGGGGAGGKGDNLQATSSSDMMNSNYDNNSEQPSAIQTAAALSDELHSKYYFNVVKEGDSVVFACDDEQECFGWVMALYRATGQAHKPTPLKNQYSGSTNHYLDAAFAYQTSAIQPGNTASAAGSSLNGNKNSLKSSVDVADQRARKHGMDEFISADPCKFQHNHLFKYLQQETLKFRLNDMHCSLGWFSPGQIYVLDEYCARYGVRTCFRHLAYLNSLLDFNSKGYFIDHTLLNYGYDFCASHVSGNSQLSAHPIGSVNFDLRPDGIGTVTVEERDMFNVIKGKLLKMIERQISNFSYCFPFGKPDGALKTTLSLLERVLMKEQQIGNSMVQNEEVRQLIRKCLELAALNNYTKLSGQANLLAMEQSPPSQAGGKPEENQERLRTSSNLSSNSSIGSYNSSASSVSSTGVQSLRGGAGANSNAGTNQNQKCLTMAMIINNEHIKPRDKLKYLIRLAELCCEQVEESNEYFSDAFAWHSDLMMDHFELFWSLFSVDMDKILNEFNQSQTALTASTTNNAASSSSSPPLSLNSALNATPLSSLSVGRSMMGSAVAAAVANNLTSAGSSVANQALISNHQLDALMNNQFLSQQREVFLLFQVLNNHLKKNSNLECRKFKFYLCDLFKPKLLTYIDFMESTLNRMLFKACEKDAQINCQLMELIFLKLEDLQKFTFNQLRWPDETLAEQLHQRLKLLSYELCDACVQKTLAAFQQMERKSNKWTSTATNSSIYTAPSDMIQMINLVLETRNRSLSLCTFNNFDQMSYHSKIDKSVETALGEMQPGLMAKMLSALDNTLAKLARHDEGNLLAPILSLTYKQGMSSSGKDVGKQYISFVSNCCDLLRHRINDELWIVNLLEEWYAIQMNTICNWLAERIDRSLHEIQLVALCNILAKLFADMSLQGVPEEKLNLKSYQTIMSRLKMEEAAAAASGNPIAATSGQGGASGDPQQSQPQQASSSAGIFSSSILSSLTSSSSASNSTTTAGSYQTYSNPSSLVSTHQNSSGQQQQSGATPSLNMTSFQRANNNDSPSALSRRFQVQGEQAPTVGEQTGDADNIADRALQSATRMFKGFWAS